MNVNEVWWSHGGLPQQFQNAVCVNVAWTIHMFVCSSVSRHMRYKLWKHISPRNRKKDEKLGIIKFKLYNIHISSCISFVCRSKLGLFIKWSLNIYIFIFVSQCGFITSYLISHNTLHITSFWVGWSKLVTYVKVSSSLIKMMTKTVFWDLHILTLKDRFKDDPVFYNCDLKNKKCGFLSFRQSQHLFLVLAGMSFHVQQFSLKVFLLVCNIKRCVFR